MVLPNPIPPLDKLEKPSLNLTVFIPHWNIQQTPKGTPCKSVRTACRNAHVSTGKKDESDRRDKEWIPGDKR